MFRINFSSLINWAFARKAIEKAGADLNEEIANYILEQYRIHAPVDTGFMVSTSDVFSEHEGLDSWVTVYAYYAHWVEFGHMAGPTWVPPQPALRNAMAMAKANFPQIAGHISLGGGPWEGMTVSLTHP